MANFNLKDYETVDERIQRFYRAFPNGRIETSLIDWTGEVGATRWIAKASVYRSPEDQVPAGVGHAFEVDGTGMANKTSALENCETSAVGRALAQAGLSGNRRTTREEMAKALLPELRSRIAKATTKDETRAVWQEANSNGILDEVKEEILARNEVITSGAT